MNLDLGDTQLIIKECKSKNLLRNQVAYILATAYWETARTMKPVVEAYWLSEDWRRCNLRYYPWHGRGYVQLTWKENYVRADKELGTNVSDVPNNALIPDVSAKILVRGMMHGWFTGKSLPDYVTLDRSDFVGARRVVNGTDKAREIADIAVKYDNVLRDAGYGEEVKQSWVDAIIRAIMGIFGK